MSISRRRFLQITGVGITGAIMGYGTLRCSRPMLRRWLTEPALLPAATGTPSEEILRTLLATTEALIDMPVEMNHYQDFFRWRSENVPGYRSLYEQFVGTVDATARQSAGRRFAEIQKAAQRRVLTKSFQVGNPPSDLGKAWTGLFDRQWLLYDRFIIREIFDLFARTDAWVKLGYETWPGKHRGLYAYTQPPTGVTGAVGVADDSPSREDLP